MDWEHDALLSEWLSEKYGRTLLRQGPQATAQIASKDATSYFSLKEEFLRQLSDLGLNFKNPVDEEFALKLWDHYDYGRSILFEGIAVRDAAERTAERVNDYLSGQASAAPSVTNPAELASRFGQVEIEALTGSNQKQRDFILALGEFLSKALQLDRGVVRYRRDVLGGLEKTISHEEADELVRSPAARLLSVDAFSEEAIPVVGHTARLVHIENAPDSLYVEPPGKTVAIASTDTSRQLRFQWFTREGSLGRPLVNRNSILGRLHRLSENLVKDHPLTVEQAAYLVLCGGIVQPRSIYGRIENTNYAPAGAYSYNHSTIALTVASWMSPEQVRRAYAKLRRKATAENTYRSHSDRNIAVFRFVVKRVASQIPKDSLVDALGEFRFPPGGSWLRNGTSSIRAATVNDSTRPVSRPRRRFATRLWPAIGPSPARSTALLARGHDQIRRHDDRHLPVSIKRRKREAQSV